LRAGGGQVPVVQAEGAGVGVVQGVGVGAGLVVTGAEVRIGAVSGTIWRSLSVLIVPKRKAPRKIACSFTIYRRLLL
jgi:hypothetical protein